MSRRRVDPRADRAARTVAPNGRRRLLPTAPTVPSRPRRDPRAERARLVVPAGRRPRLERGRAPGTAAASPAPHVGAASVANALPTLRVIDDPAFLVLVVLDPEAGVSEAARGLIASGRALADGRGGAVAVLAPPGTADLGAAGADRVLTPAGIAADAYDPEALAAATLAAVAALAPRHVLFADEPTGGGDVARRVAAALGERPFTGVETMKADRVGRRARGGGVEASRAPVRVMTVADGAVPPLEGVRHEARPWEAPEPAAFARRLGPAREVAVDPEGLPLAEAAFVVAGGNGVTDWAGFRDLARRLNAAPGGSRVVCDAGHLPRDRQVGASGTILSSRVYLAFGIAGAPQHLQGIAGVEHVLAVNTDLHAEMIKRADLAVVADAQEVMPALARLLAACAP